jgi:hypothetical protein
MSSQNCDNTVEPGGWCHGVNRRANFIRDVPALNAEKAPCSAMSANARKSQPTILSHMVGTVDQLRGALNLIQPNVYAQPALRPFDRNKCTQEHRKARLAPIAPRRKWVWVRVVLVLLVPAGPGPQ